MLRIWGRTTSSNVMKVLWACEELGVPFERIDAGGSFGRTDTPEYRKMNPNRLVPTIEDDGFVLWESNAIVRYLAARHGEGGLCPRDLQARADAERWMDWQLSVLGPAFGPVFHGLVRTPPEQRDRSAIEAAVQKTGEALRILEERLEGQSWICGDRPTIADIPFGPIVHRWMRLVPDRPEMRNLEGWYRRAGERDGFARHIAAIPIS